MKRVLVTGCSGLVGSEAAHYFDSLGYRVLGIDNNLHAASSGSHDGTNQNLQWLKASTKYFRHENVDLRSRRAIGLLLARDKYDLIVHCAGQSSPDFAHRRPLDDFDVNALGTMNLLEAARQSCPEAPFVTMSSSRVYGEAAGEYPIAELPTRYDYVQPEDYQGVNESCRIDASAHTILGATKLAADIMTQEYGRSFNMPTCVFRPSCLVGSRPSGTLQEGFLNDLVRVAIGGDRFMVVGYKGKQVRDPLHTRDVVAAIHAFAETPRFGEVYNLGGGRGNSVSIFECIERLKDMTGTNIPIDYQPFQRTGEHTCYITDWAKFCSHYPAWGISCGLDEILTDLLRAEWRVSADHIPEPVGSSVVDTGTVLNSSRFSMSVPGCNWIG